MNARLASPLLSLLLLVPAAAQERGAAPDRGADGPRPSVTSEVDASDVSALRALVAEEAAHRDRLARLRRLRELAASSGNRERLAALDDLERRELAAHQNHRERRRASLSEAGRRDADDFLARGGTWRARVADHHAARERAIQHQQRRERSAQAGQPPSTSDRTPRRAAPPARPPQRPQPAPRSGSPR